MNMNLNELVRTGIKVTGGPGTKTVVADPIEVMKRLEREAKKNLPKKPMIGKPIILSEEVKLKRR